VALTIVVTSAGKKKLSLSLNPISSFCLIYMYFAFSFVALTKFYPIHFTLGPSVVDSDFFALASYSTKIIFITSTYVTLFSNRNNSRDEIRYQIYTKPTISKKILFFLFFFFLSWVSLTVGIGKMGAENTRLPFHLSGIIQFLRVEFAPFIALIFYVSIKKDVELNKTRNSSIAIFLGLFFIWTLFETIVRVSKAAIFYEFLPIIVYEIIQSTKNKTLKKLTLKLLPFAFVLLVVYAVVENSRNQESFTTEIDVENNATYNNPQGNNYLVRPYTRFFINGHHFLTSYSYIDNNAFFDFSKMPAVLVMGGAAKYKTYVIDGYPDGVHHSSGSTYLMDALLCGGYGLSYIFLVILLAICKKTDEVLTGRQPIVYGIVLAMFVYKYIIAGLSVSIIVDPMSLNGLLVTLLLLIFINRIKIRPSI
jgi:hypothetical protein